MWPETAGIRGGESFGIKMYSQARMPAVPASGLYFEIRAKEVIVDFRPGGSFFREKHNDRRR